jgi:DNA invertase Pin-like site-specific DNA recombinase
VSVADFERNVIHERTTAGIRAARQRGTRIGRQPALTRRRSTLKTEQRALALCLLREISGRSCGDVPGAWHDDLQTRGSRSVAQDLQ